MLTYSQATQRSLRAVLLAIVCGFAVIAATRVQLAAGYSTPLAFDMVVWTAMFMVAMTAAAGAGVCVWMRVSDLVALRRYRLHMTTDPDTEPLMIAVRMTGGRHRTEAGQ
ncbi:hypothetical protein [Nocardia salmonicida]|uniref:hypothetical protein n=1 Tax=Nocardia salmonicida TaxID=53431 RepID=UPI002E2DA148|nr:hypothetical protein [Nocardia salmonicida]